MLYASDDILMEILNIMNKQLIYLNIKLTLRSLIFYLSFSFFTVAYAFLTIQLGGSGTFFENFDRMAYIEIVLYLMLFCVAMFFAKKESKLEDVCFVPREQTYFARLVALLLCSAVYLLLPIAHLIIGAIRQGIGGSYLLRSLLLAVVRWGMIIVLAQTIGYLVGYIARSVYAYLFSIPFTILQGFANTYMFEKLFGLGEDSAVSHLLSLQRYYLHGGDISFRGPQLDALFLVKALFIISGFLCLISILRMICRKSVRSGTTAVAVVSIACIIGCGIAFFALHPNSYSKWQKLYAVSSPQSFTVTGCRGTVSLDEWSQYCVTLDICALGDADTVTLRLDESMRIRSLIVDGALAEYERQGDLLTLHCGVGDHSVTISAIGRVSYANDNVVVDIYTSYSGCALPSTLAFLPKIDGNDDTVEYELTVCSRNPLVSNLEFSQDGNTYIVRGTAKTICFYAGYFTSFELNGVTVYCPAYAEQADIVSHYELACMSGKSHIDPTTGELTKEPWEVRDRAIIYDGGYDALGFPIVYDDYVLLAY